eukprot:TRINITY_DN8490_c0_g1_i2.p1 TRINITY_DN8490_c0_g1~~TRINITY_DN8490_c0_g1_i2.p1  ORF type:complete len:551 (-),score=99.59 TRINITY_DN8490_c0_g1_i2:422-2074(-)
MDLISHYGDGDEVPIDPSVGVSTADSGRAGALVVIPEVAPDVALYEEAKTFVQADARKVDYNLPVDVLYAPVHGPQAPTIAGPKARTLQQVMPESEKNTWTGHVVQTFMSHSTFDEQFHNFSNKGFASNPLGPAVLNGKLNIICPKDSSGSLSKSLTNVQRKRVVKEDASDINGYLGPWAPMEDQAEYDADLPTLTEEERKHYEETKPVPKRKRRPESSAPKEPRKWRDLSDNEDEPGTDPANRFGPEPTSKFHGTSRKDYQGRTFVDLPTDLPDAAEQCFLPKRCVHTWNGHTKGVSAIRFFPESGHLLLSASMDNTVRIWDVFNSKKCLRTYSGHSKAVRDICFTNDGRQFLSCGYDKLVRLWDTESGQCISTFTNNRTPYCVKFNPTPELQNIFLAGSSCKKILQYDIRNGKIEQEYNEHLGAVNSITFVDENRRFISSSDDKALRVWEFGIPVTIKLISEPHMHSMPSVSLHPNKSCIAAQSLDNQIIIYEARTKFKLNTKKRFTGHLNSGYACQVNFSSDGKYLISGDAEGKLWIWDWKSCKAYK